MGYHTQQKGDSMHYWALVFLAVAVTAGIFGFSGIAVASAGIAQILFYIFLLLFAVAMIARFLNGPSR